MGRVISLLNEKGGVGKTSLCLHLGGMLAADGRRVLLIDNDPQGSLTKGFIGPKAAGLIPAKNSTAALYDDHVAPTAEALITPTKFDRLFIVPCSTAADPRAGFEFVPAPTAMKWVNMSGPELWRDSEDGIREFTEEAGEQFDIILIDCPPNTQRCAWSALAASDFVIVPLQPEDYGSQGLLPVQQAIASCRKYANPKLRLLGYLLSMIDKRLQVHKKYEDEIRTEHGNKTFVNVIPTAKDFKEAVGDRMPISHYKAKCSAAQAVGVVIQEMFRRMEDASIAGDRRVA